MKITPDYSEALESGPVPAGVYNTRIDSWTEKTSKAGAKYLSWKLVIFGAQGDSAKQNNRVVFLTTMTSGPGAGILKSFVKAALGEVPTEFDTDNLVGRELQVTLVDRQKPDGEPGWPEVKAMAPIRH